MGGLTGGRQTGMPRAASGAGSGQPAAARPNPTESGAPDSCFQAAGFATRTVLPLVWSFVNHVSYLFVKNLSPDPLCRHE
jgi:hypothetical protein